MRRGLATGCASKTDTASSGGGGDKGGSGQFVIGYSQSNNAEPYRQQLQYYVKQHKNLKTFVQWRTPPGRQEPRPLHGVWVDGGRDGSLGGYAVEEEQQVRAQSIAR